MRGLRYSEAQRKYQAHNPGRGIEDIFQKEEIKTESAEEKTSALLILTFFRLQRAFYLAAAETSGTDINMAGSTVNYCLYSFYVRFPRPVGAPVRVAHLDAEGNTLVTKLAFSHLLHLLACICALTLLIHSVVYFNRLITKMQAYFSDSQLI